MAIISLSDRQKSIVNPFPEDYNDSYRSGVEYDYGNETKKFVIDAIHESYLYFFKFPEPGTIIQGQGVEITLADFRAYFALYPQNGKLVDQTPQPISIEESLGELRRLVSRLNDLDVLEEYSTLSSPEYYLREYQQEEEIAKLISIPSNHSRIYKNKLRTSLGLETIQYSTDVGLDLLDLPPDISTYVGSDTNVDLYDWRNNCEPGDESNRTYYNSADSHYYFTSRTNDISNDLIGTLNTMSQMKRTLELQINNEETESIITALSGTLFGGGPISQDDIDSVWNSSPQAIKDNYRSLMNKALREILKMTGRYSSDNFDVVARKIGFPPTKFPLLTFKDTRPGSRWMYAVKIPSRIITLLPLDESSDLNLPSFQDYSLSPLEKARRIIKHSDLPDDILVNKSSFSKKFVVEELLRDMSYVRSTLRGYESDLIESNITPSMISNIDLEKEVDRLNSFFDLLALFYNYNQISIQDEDLLEMYFSEDYTLDHICVNGNFYAHGCGNRIYLNNTEEVLRVLNAFSLLTSTSFSFISNSSEIYNESVITSQSRKVDVLNFLSTYAYPSIDISAIQANRAFDQKRLNLINKRKKNVFELLTDLSAPGENLNLYQQMFSKRDLKYRIASTLSTIDCDTGQAKAAKYALAFWQASTSKTKIRSLIRQTIILLKQEAIVDAETAAFLSSYSSYASDDPNSYFVDQNRARRDIEKYINEQISCSLDVLGDFIEDNFLDPVGAPPVANQLVRETLDKPIKIELKKTKMIGLKTRQSDLYQKAIETIILNFLKSVVAGIAKDVLNAVLGCATPEEQLSDPIKLYSYGLADINDYVTEVDLVAAAEKSNIFNYKREVIDGTEQVTKTPPRLSQIKRFILDVSNMVTPAEAEQLLSGEAPLVLLEHLYESLGNPETAKGFTYTRTYQQFADAEPEEVIIVPDVYKNFEITEQKISDFFLEIGAFSGDVNSDRGLTPLEAYCADREGFINPLALQLDVDDAAAQYSFLVSDKINKINNLCDWLRDALRIRTELEELIASLPLMTWYDDLLREIANLSNYVANWLASLFDDLFGKDPAPEKPPEFNLYHTQLGVELFFQIFPTLRQVPISQVYYRPSFVPGEDNQVVRFAEYITPANYGGEIYVSNQAARFRNEDDVAALLGSSIIETVGNQTQNHVNNFITARPPRIPIPQYRTPIQNHYDVWDIAYYTLRHGSPELQQRIERNLPDASIARSRFSGNRDNNEIDFLSDVSQVVYDYFVDSRASVPYEGSTGYTRLAPRQNQIRIFYEKTRLNSDKVAEFDIANNNRFEASVYRPGSTGDLTDVDYGIFTEQGSTEGNYNIKVDARNQLVVSTLDQNENIVLPLNTNIDFQNTYGNFSIGTPTTIVRDSAASTKSALERDFDCLSMNNYTIRIDSTINKSAVLRDGKRNLPRYISALNRKPLSESDEPCLDREVRFRAESAIQCIQARMQRSLVNMRPLTSVYPSWGSLGTIRLLSDYFTRNIKKELEQKEILGAFYSLIPAISEVYPRLEIDDENYLEGVENNPVILQTNTPEQNMANIVESILYGMLRNIQKHAGSEVSRSLFSANNENGRRYRRMLGKFYRGVVSALHPDAGELRSTEFFGIPENDREKVRNLLLRCYELNNEGLVEDVTPLGLKLGAYYFPVAFQVASYLIYYDRAIRFAERYSDTYFRFEVEIAGADDNLLTAAKGQFISKFSEVYTGFPVSVPAYDGSRVITYYNKDQVLDRIDYLQGLDVDSTGIISLQQLLSINSLQELERIYSSIWGLRSVTGRVIARYYIPSIPEDQAFSVRNNALTDFTAKAATLRRLFTDSNYRSVGEGRFIPQAERDNLERGARGGLQNFEPSNPNDPDPLVVAMERVAFEENNLHVYKYGHEAVVRSIFNAADEMGITVQELYEFVPTENTTDVYFEVVGNLLNVYGRYLLGNFGAWESRENRHILEYGSETPISDRSTRQGGEGDAPEYSDDLSIRMGKLFARDFFRTNLFEIYSEGSSRVANIRTETINLRGLISSNE